MRLDPFISNGHVILAYNQIMKAIEKELLSGHEYTKHVTLDRDMSGDVTFSFDAKRHLVTARLEKVLYMEDPGVYVDITSLERRYENEDDSLLFYPFPSCLIHFTPII